MKKLSPKTKKIFIFLAITILAIGGWMIYKKVQSNNKTGTTADGQPVDLSPATQDHKQQVQDNKDEIIKQQNQNSNSSTDPSTGKKQVGVSITSARAENISAFVTGVFEEGGTCTATFKQGDIIISRTSVGFQNASYTQCAPITPNLPNGGTWAVVVDYSSSTANGASQSQSF